MKAVLFYAPGDIRFGDIEPPEAGPGEVVIEIKAALTCGTDLKTFKRGHPVIIKQVPSVFGHEFAGVIAQVGPGLAGFGAISVGQRVVAANSAPCGGCFFCQRERPSLCENLEMVNGAYAEYIKLPARLVEKNLLPIPEDVTFKQAALVEPLACAVHGIERSNLHLGDVVCIIGHGPIGLMLTCLTKLKGARVIVVGRNPFKLQMARQFGADAAVDITAVGDPVEAVRALTPAGRGVDVAIEAVGLPETWEQAMAVARPGGLVNLFGGCKSGTRCQLDTRRLHYEELDIIGVFHHTPRTVRAALSLIAGGAIDADALITHEMPLERLEEAFQLMESGAALKVAIEA
jgi:L-iditol 2-dehydrogenase